MVCGTVCYPQRPPSSINHHRCFTPLCARISRSPTDSPALGEKKEQQPAMAAAKVASPTGVAEDGTAAAASEAQRPEDPAGGLATSPPPPPTTTTVAFSEAATARVDATQGGTMAGDDLATARAGTQVRHALITAGSGLAFARQGG